MSWCLFRSTKIVTFLEPLLMLLRRNHFHKEEPTHSGPISYNTIAVKLFSVEVFLPLVLLNSCISVHLSEIVSSVFSNSCNSAIWPPDCIGSVNFNSGQYSLSEQAIRGEGKYKKTARKKARKQTIFLILPTLLILSFILSTSLFKFAPMQLILFS